MSAGGRALLPKPKQPIYDSVRTARYYNRLKEPPGDLSWEDRHWWLAGWNDKDIEIDGPETPAKKVRRGKP